MPTPDAELAALIRALAAREDPPRRKAGVEIFRMGGDLARVAAESWFADAELAACFPLRASGWPETTVGVAVEPGTFEAIRRAHGWPALADVPPEQDAQEFEIVWDDAVRLDVLTARDRAGAGAIARFLDRFGEGIQQIEFLVADLDRATQRLKEKFGIQAVYPVARAGANHTRVNFVLVPAAGRKLLIELVQFAPVIDRRYRGGGTAGRGNLRG